MTNIDAIKLADYCREKLDLANAKVPADYGWSSLPLCLIDAIFSINANYKSTYNTVKRFESYFEVHAKFTVSEFISLHEHHSVVFMAEDVYKNRQRTSTRNGILKAEAVFEAAKLVKQFQAEHIFDAHKIINNADFETAYKKIRGQGSGVSMRYFFMLTGDETQIKPDRRILAFIFDGLGKTVTVDYAAESIVSTAKNLQSDYPHLTPRDLDHAIWKYKSGQ